MTGSISTPDGQTIYMKMIDSVWTVPVRPSDINVTVRAFHADPGPNTPVFTSQPTPQCIKHHEALVLPGVTNAAAYWNSPIYLHSPRHLQVHSVTEKGQGSQLWESKHNSGFNQKGMTSLKALQNCKQRLNEARMEAHLRDLKTKTCGTASCRPVSSILHSSWQKTPADKCHHV